MARRFLTTTESSAWLAEHYDMDVNPRTLLRLAKAGTLRSHRAHEHAWYTFSEAALREYAEGQGFRPTS